MIILVVEAGEIRLNWPVSGVVSGLVLLTSVRVIGRVGYCRLIAGRLLAMNCGMLLVVGMMRASGFGYKVLVSVRVHVGIECFYCVIRVELVMRMTIGRLVGSFPILKICFMVWVLKVPVVNLQMALAGRFISLRWVRYVVVVFIVVLLIFVLRYVCIGTSAIMLLGISARRLYRLRPRRTCCKGRP